MTNPLGYIRTGELCWTKTNNKTNKRTNDNKEHVMYISRLETVGDYKREIGKAAL